jgi:hypothetical protein
MDNYRCGICLENVLETDIECNGLAHLVYVEVDEAPLEKIQERKFGVYVDPETGKIVKAKALNNPLILG